MKVTYYHRLLYYLIVYSSTTSSSTPLLPHRLLLYYLIVIITIIIVLFIDGDATTLTQTAKELLKSTNASDERKQQGKDLHTAAGTSQIANMGDCSAYVSIHCTK